MRGAAFDFASSPWKSPPGRSPDADLPYEFRLPPGTFDVLKYYDDWVRGGVLSGVPVADGADDGGDDDGPGACDDDDDHPTRARLVTRWLHRVLSAVPPFDVHTAPISFDDFEISASLPAVDQRAIFARHGWPQGPPRTQWMLLAMLWLARQRYSRAYDLATDLHPGKTITFPKTFKEFCKAPMRDGGFYFVGKGSGRGRQTRAPSPAFDDSDVLTESDFDLFDADHTSQDAL